MTASPDVPAGGNAPKTGKSGKKMVERRTGLRGQSIGAAQQPKRRLTESRAERDLFGPGAEVPYAPVETAHRKLVLALLDRQDLVVSRLMEMINDLQYRVDDLELAVADFTERPADGEREVPE